MFVNTDSDPRGHTQKETYADIHKELSVSLSSILLEAKLIWLFLKSIKNWTSFLLLVQVSNIISTNAGARLKETQLQDHSLADTKITPFTTTFLWRDVVSWVIKMNTSQ